MVTIQGDDDQMNKKIFICLFLLISFAPFSQETSDANSNDVEELVVVGTKASLKSAIEKQRESDQVVSIVDSDALGEFPDEPED